MRGFSLYSLACDVSNSGRTRRYTASYGDASLSYADVTRLWEEDEAFRALCTSALVDAPFVAYRWETPPITAMTSTRRFEFVLLDSPWLRLPPDVDTFARFFTDDERDAGVVSFANLGGDAILIVPSPRAPAEHYSDFAAFMRGAPNVQKHALWQVIGRTIRERLDDRPVWVSTAGGGVAWLHVRLDSRPKYYGHAPYRSG